MPPAVAPAAGRAWSRVSTGPSTTRRPFAAIPRCRSRGSVTLATRSRPASTAGSRSESSRRASVPGSSPAVPRREQLHAEAVAQLVAERVRGCARAGAAAELVPRLHERGPVIGEQPPVPRGRLQLGTEARAQLVEHAARERAQPLLARLLGHDAAGRVDDELGRTGGAAHAGAGGAQQLGWQQVLRRARGTLDGKAGHGACSVSRPRLTRPERVPARRGSARAARAGAWHDPGP